MDRRDSIKSIILGSVAGGLALHGCKPEATSKEIEDLAAVKEYLYGRTPKEEAQNDALLAETFFNPHEFETIAVLCNLILPPEGDVGGALEAEVPEFIEFMAKDFPEFQPTLRGGLMFLDHTCNTEFNLEFKSSSELQQKQFSTGSPILILKFLLINSPWRSNFFLNAQFNPNRILHFENWH